jgi:hypothetical protein
VKYGKLVYYGVIKDMGEDRWPNIVLKHIEDNEAKRIPQGGNKRKGGILELL